jgi:hypothetical protein
MFLGFWVYIRFFGGCDWRFRPYGESLFPDARNAGPEKSNQKGLLLRAARSLGLGVPSLRDRSGRSASGLLRCTSSRCVWLRQTVAALPPPDQSLHSAFRRRSWIKIKSFVELALILCRSCRRLRSFDLACACVGAELAREGGLTADPFVADCTQSNCRSEPARDDVLPAYQYLSIVLNPCGSLACQRWRPDSRPSSCRSPQSNCEPARESGMTADHFL